MINDTHMARIRREIARLANGNSKVARVLVLELLSTDWNEVVNQDLGTCHQCDKKVRYKDLIRYYFGGHGLKICPTCDAMTFPRKCTSCGREHFLHPSMYDTRCPECRSSRCPVCNTKVPDLRCICDGCRQTYGLDLKWIQRESRKIHTNVGRAVSLHLPGTLTFDQWIKTVVAFNWRCAYCQIEPYEHVDHFIPLSKKGGTEKANCVPACRSCNQLKHRLHPDEVTAIPQEALERVRTFLNQFR